MDKIVEDVFEEMDRQYEKYGQQKHPSIPSNMHTDAVRNYSLMIPREQIAKNMTNHAVTHGELTWSHIALEELCESIEAPTEQLRRKQLVQLAGVVLQWIKNIDNNEHSIKKG